MFLFKRRACLLSICTSPSRHFNVTTSLSFDDGRPTIEIPSTVSLADCGVAGAGPTVPADPTAAAFAADDTCCTDDDGGCSVNGARDACGACCASVGGNKGEGPDVDGAEGAGGMDGTDGALADGIFPRDPSFCRSCGTTSLTMGTELG